MDDYYEEKPAQVVGLAFHNYGGEIMNQPNRLLGKLITTRCGMDDEHPAKSIYYHLPLYSDLQHPLTIVSRC